MKKFRGEEYCAVISYKFILVITILNLLLENKFNEGMELYRDIIQDVYLNFVKKILFLIFQFFCPKFQVMRIF